MKRTLLILSTIFAAALLPCRAETIVALTSGNRLLTFDSATPATVSRIVTVAGLANGESLVGIDFRPATGGLFGLGSTSRLYSINAATGAATAVGAAGVFTLSGDALWLRLQPHRGSHPHHKRHGPGSPRESERRHLDRPPILFSPYSATDPNAGQNPNVASVAYTNSFSTALATTLYDIDSGP